MKNLLKLLIILVIIYAAAVTLSERSFNLDKFISRNPLQTQSQQEEKVKIVSEESVVIDVVKNASSSVVTIGIEQTPLSRRNSGNDPFSLFFGQEDLSQDTNQESYIGSGFIIGKDGLVVTNRHVVSDREVNYIVVDNKGNKYDVERIYRDPLNDIAILKTQKSFGSDLKELELGDSSKLQVGQLAIAIGTPLGEFRNTVTTGVISGLGRGVVAGSPFEGYVERLDNVIQTDAAINPGNSGGPLLNSKSQAIGINTAIASSGENIGFAIPINILKDSLDNFNKTGRFERPYLGVSYTMIARRAALLNDIPEGAYVQLVVPETSAEKAGILEGDIIIKIDGKKINTDGGLAAAIAEKKIGDSINITVYRDDKTIDLKAALQATPE